MLIKAHLMASLKKKATLTSSFLIIVYAEKSLAEAAALFIKNCQYLSLFVEFDVT